MGIISSHMKKTATIAIAILFLTGILLSCTKEKPRPTARAVQIILDTCSVYEPNPLYADEAKEINELFRRSLVNRDKLRPDELQGIYSQAIALYELNDVSEFEDSVDAWRIMMRRSVCMAAAAVVSQPDEAIKYFDAAKGVLNQDGKVDELMEDRYSALLVLEILYLHEHKLLKATNKESARAAINNFTHISRKTKDGFVEVVKEF